MTLSSSGLSDAFHERLSATGLPAHDAERLWEALARADVGTNAAELLLPGLLREVTGECRPCPFRNASNALVLPPRFEPCVLTLLLSCLRYRAVPIVVTGRRPGGNSNRHRRRRLRAAAIGFVEAWEFLTGTDVTGLVRTSWLMLIIACSNWKLKGWQECV